MELVSSAFHVILFVEIRGDFLICVYLVGAVVAGGGGVVRVSHNSI